MGRGALREDFFKEMEGEAREAEKDAVEQLLRLSTTPIGKGERLENRFMTIVQCGSFIERIRRYIETPRKWIEEERAMNQDIKEVEETKKTGVL